MKSLLERGYARETDEAAISEIEKYLVDDPDAGRPTALLPKEGEVDLTVTGAELYYALRKEVFGIDRNDSTGLVRDVDASHVEIYATSREVAAMAFYQSFFEGRETAEKVVSTSEILDIGAWRARWWERFDSGWRIDVVIEPLPPTA